MRFKKTVILLLFTLVSMFSFVNIYANERPLIISVNSFGSTNVYTLYSHENKSREQLNNYLEEAKNITLKLSELSDNFNASSKYNNIYYINNNANLDIEIEYELYNMLYLAEKYKENTNGHFDVSIGLIIDEWKKLIDTPERNITKTEYDLKVNEIKNIPVIKDGIILNEVNNKYYVKIKNGVKLDLGAIAKGYSVQVVDNYFKEKGLKYYKVEGSASSLNYGENKEREGNFYHIGVNHPYISELHGYIKVKNINVTTSGDTFQNNTLYGDFMHHIISPYSKIPENKYRNLTLITKDATYGDALSTALFSMDEEDMIEFALKNDVEVIAIKYDGEVIKQLKNTEFVLRNDKFDKTPDITLLEEYKVETIINNKNIELKLVINPNKELVSYEILKINFDESDKELIEEHLSDIILKKYKINAISKKTNNETLDEISNLLNNVYLYIINKKGDINDDNIEIEFSKYYFEKLDTKDNTPKSVNETFKTWLIISGVVIVLGGLFYFVGKKSSKES